MHTIQLSDDTLPLTTLVDQTATSQEPILLTTKEDKRAILLSVEMFEALAGIHHHTHRPLISVNELQTKLQQDLIDSGYDTRDSILHLLRNVKQEMMNERDLSVGYPS